MSIGKPALGYINTVFKWVYFLNTVFFPRKSLCVWDHSPHNNSNKSHDGLVEGVEEVSESLSLFLHTPNDQAEAHWKHHQTEGINPIGGAWERNHFLLGNLLGGVSKVEYRIVHNHLHLNDPLAILGLELQEEKEKKGTSFKNEQESIWFKNQFHMILVILFWFRDFNS